jgi:glycine oxidase
MFYPEDALVDPRDVMAALRLACSRLGVDLREGEPAVSVEAGELQTRVMTNTSALMAPAVVLAAGAWSGAMQVSIAGSPFRLPDSYPVRGHLLGVALQPQSIGPILRHHHTYVLQRSSGWTIFGASTEHAGFDRTPDASVVADISRRAAALVPALRGAGDPRTWLGFRPGSAEPRIHRTPGSCLWLAYGHYRNGILLAPATARLVSAEIIATAGTGRLSSGGIPRSSPRPGGGA